VNSCPSLFKYFRNWSQANGGFSLIEMLVVISIVTILSGSLILTFSRVRSDPTHTVNIVIAEIRDTQVRALSGVRYKHPSESISGPLLRCGYGITPGLVTTEFRVYAGPNSPGTDCTAEDRRFNDPPDKIVRTVKLQDPNFEFKNAIAGKNFYDIFFEPPDRKVFIDNSSALAGSATNPAKILLGPLGVDCAVNPTNCRAICIYTSGRIEVPSNLTCPGI